MAQQVELNKSANQKFGFLFTCLLTIAGVWCFYNDFLSFGFVLTISSAICLVVTCVRPNSLEKLASIWLKIGTLLGKIFNPIVLGIVFFGIMSPIGIFMRLLGRDLLQLKSLEQESYWQTCEKTASIKMRFKKQF